MSFKHESSSNKSTWHKPSVRKQMKKRSLRCRRLTSKKYWSYLNPCSSKRGRSSHKVRIRESKSKPRRCLSLSLLTGASFPFGSSTTSTKESSSTCYSNSSKASRQELAPNSCQVAGVNSPNVFACGCQSHLNVQKSAKSTWLSLARSQSVRKF